jgi:hypothetical protein
MASPTPSDGEGHASGVPAKRKGTHLGNGNSDKKKRSRGMLMLSPCRQFLTFSCFQVSFSCSECHRRKQKASNHCSNGYHQLSAAVTLIYHDARSDPLYSI